MKTDNNAGIKKKAALVRRLFQSHMGLFVLWSTAPVLLNVLQPVIMPFLTKVIPEIEETSNHASLPFQLLAAGAAVLVLMAASFWIFSYAALIPAITRTMTDIPSASMLGIEPPFMSVSALFHNNTP